MEYLREMNSGYTAEIVICSPAVVSGQKRNNVGALIQDTLDAFNVRMAGMTLVEGSKETVSNLVVEASSDFLIFSGGTSEKSNYVVFEALKSLLNSRFEEVEQKVRSVGVEKTELALRSRPVIGKRGRIIVMAIPSSTNGARDALEVIYPWIFDFVSGD